VPSEIPHWPKEAAELLKEAFAMDSSCYAVGGAVRDLILKRHIHDLDIASFEAEKLSKNLARRLKAKLIVLDDVNIVFRLILNPSYKITRQIDIAKIQGRAIEEDLLRRDFTINAMALSARDGVIIDPREGLKDIFRKLLHCESKKILRADPLRILRAFRIAAQLDFKIEDKTLRLIAQTKNLVGKPAGERIQGELMALLEIPSSSVWLKLMDQAGVLTSLFKELEPSRTTAVEYYGNGGVLKHSLETASRADFLLRHLSRVFPEQGNLIIQRLNATGSFPTQRATIVLAALLHDVSKPETARLVKGRLHFFGHDSLGAAKTAKMLEKLRFSRERILTVKTAILHHLRPGYLAEAPAVTDKAVYRFFRDVKDQALPVLLASWADHASYLPEKSLIRLLPLASRQIGEDLRKIRPVKFQKTIRHLQTVSLLMRRFFDSEKKVVPKPLINGNDVMKALKIPPGPKIGEILEKIREAQATGKIKTKDAALKFLTRKKSLPPGA
jgi:poly(A) polymerase